MQQGQFRQDLLFRLRSLTIDLPPLRERKGDIQELVMYFLAKFWGQQGEGTKGLSAEFLDTLLAYDWPGNVRELMNTLERALAAAYWEPILIPQHLPTYIRIKVALRAFKKMDSPNVRLLPDSLGEEIPKLRHFLEEMKQEYLTNLLAATGHDLKVACRLSGMSRSSLYGHLKKYKIIADN